MRDDCRVSEMEFPRSNDIRCCGNGGGGGGGGGERERERERRRTRSVARATRGDAPRRQTEREETFAERGSAAVLSDLFSRAIIVIIMIARRGDHRRIIRLAAEKEKSHFLRSLSQSEEARVVREDKRAAQGSLNAKSRLLSSFLRRFPVPTREPRCTRFDRISRSPAKHDIISSRRTDGSIHVGGGTGFSRATLWNGRSSVPLPSSLLREHRIL